MLKENFFMNKEILEVLRHKFNRSTLSKTLFYPCCWYDTLEPITVFQDLIENYHFSDTVAIGLPHVVNSIDDDKPCNSSFQQKRPSFIKTLNHSFSQYYHYESSLMITNEDAGDLRLDHRSILYREQFRSHENNQIFNINCHRYDCRQAFHNIDSLSVFYYRGDSMGEGGSGVWWFGPDLFPQLVDKLEDGGFIITDGSNPDPNHLYTPWMSLYTHSHFHFRDLKEGEQPKSFTYRNKYFQLLGDLSERYGTVYVWQVCDKLD